MVAEFINAVISSFLVLLAAIFPSSPVVFSIDPNLVVPAYSGVLVALLLYFRDIISRESVMAIKGFETAQLRYVTLASVLTIVLGFLPRVQVETRISVITGIAFAVLPAIAYGFKPLEGLRETFENEPTPVDALSVGIAQALAILFGLPRGGLSALALVLSGYDAKKILKFSLQVAPAYLVVEIIRAGQCQPRPKWLGPLTFTFSFFVTFLLVWVLFKLTERLESRTFLVFYGLVGVILYLMGVLI
ncbi:UDP kinase [Thermococcus guaymasensis DSM 11113]|uniref:Undecaprenyl-diphosphatase n=1 Tax=Thermococcus guaymasensis DSM 11113 TaxID=1432656 RepID=A0A0X1KL01_9EURY|nr:undecaprenyl-diphosphate phosphatase [Thermococcus guaymasensis]AJC71936.1 UDP kinase [Thermococcus guaymasensis DSM 11113]